MKKMSLVSTAKGFKAKTKGFTAKTKRRSKGAFLGESKMVAPLGDLLALIYPHAPFQHQRRSGVVCRRDHPEYQLPSATGNLLPRL
jgi:hypothetical protein